MATYAIDQLALRQHGKDLRNLSQQERYLNPNIDLTDNELRIVKSDNDSTPPNRHLQDSLLNKYPERDNAIPLSANLMLTLGILHWRKKDFSKALELLQAALNIGAPLKDKWFFAQCFNAKALVMTGMGKNNDAIDAYKKTLQFAPDQIFIWNNLGNLYFKMGQPDKAIESYMKALKQDSENTVSWNGLGDVYQDVMSTDDAIEAYQKAIQLAPKFAYPWNGLGDVYSKINQFDKALNAYSKAIKLKEDFIEPWISSGKLYMEQDRFNEAVNSCQKAAELDPENVQVWVSLGNLYFSYSHYDEAIEAFNRVIQMNCGTGLIYQTLASSFFEKKQFVEAVSFYQKSIGLLKNKVEQAIVWNKLGDTKRKLNAYEDALDAYRTADKLCEPGFLFDRNTYKGKDIEDNEKGNLPMDKNLATTIEKDKEHMEISLTQKENVVPTRIENTKKGDSFMKLHPSILERINVHKEGLVSSDQPNEKKILISLLDKDNDEEAQLVEKENEMTVKSAYEWSELGNLYLKAGSYGDAISAYKHAIELAPEFGWAYSNLALTYYRQGQYEEAVSLYLKSIELFRTSEEKAVTLNRLGDAYRGLSDYDNAMQVYHEADQYSANEDDSDEQSADNPDTHTEDSIVEEPDETLSFEETLQSELEPASDENETDEQQDEIYEENPMNLENDDNENSAPEESQLLESGWLPNDDSENKKVADEDQIENAEFVAMLSSLTNEDEESNDQQEMTSKTDSMISEESVEPKEKTSAEWNELGKMYLTKSLYDEAISAYQKAIDATPGFSWSFINNLAMAYYGKGKYDQVTSLYSEHTGTQHETEEADLVDVNLEGKDGFESNESEHEQEVVDETELEMDAIETTADLEGSEAKFEEDKIKFENELVEFSDLEAEDVQEKVQGSNLDPDEINSVEASLGEEPEAQLVEQEQEMTVKSAYEWSEMGNLYLKAGSYNDAIAAYRKAIELAPEFGWAYSNLALAYYRQGQYKEAVLLYRKSIDLFRTKEEKAVSWNRLGNAYRRSNDHQSAMKAYRTADKLSMNSSSLLSRTRLVLMNNE